MSMSCTMTDDQRICALCGTVGHISRNCLQKLCFNCGLPGHSQRACRNDTACDPFCKSCKSYGHVETLVCC